MKKWTDFLSEEPSKEHSRRVMNAVSPELELNRAQNGRRLFSWRLVGGLGLLGIAILGVFQTLRDGVRAVDQFSEKSAEQSEFAIALNDVAQSSDMAGNPACDFDLVNDLDLMTDLESLEAWNGVDV